MLSAQHGEYQSFQSVTSEPLLSPSHAFTTDLHEPHHIQRFFIGAMPEKVISTTEAESNKKKRRFGLFRSSSTSDSHQDAMDAFQFIEDHAFDFFIQEGGNAEDWGETQEESVRKEMKRRWKESEWGKMWSKRDKAKRNRGKSEPASPVSRWVGGSFEVGNIMGLNILKEPAVSIRAPSVQSRSGPSSPASRPLLPGGRSTVSYFSPERAPPHSVPNISITECASEGADLDNQPYRATQDRDDSSGNSKTSLLKPSTLVKARSDGALRPIKRLSSSFRLQSEPHTSNRLKGKNKAVHYADPPSQVSSPGANHPTDVLAREGSDVEGTSAGAGAGASNRAAEQVGQEHSHAAMTDRMLVRVGHSREALLAPNFDDVRSRATSNLHYEDWQEFMVVWKRSRIELYEEYGFPHNVWSTSKKLAHTIPLKSIKTRLSLFSFVDLTFCLTCPSASSDGDHHLFHQGNGSSIFVFKVKVRSRALDWMWRLWRYLGGNIPPSLEIRIPTMDSRVKIDIPSCEEEMNNRKLLNTENILALCMGSFRSMGNWRSILNYQLKQHRSLQLCWRFGSNLDWVYFEDDIEGNLRWWSVLCGLALKQSVGAAHLELRLAEHSPTYLCFKNIRLDEPPSIEGYVDLIKPSNHAKRPMYLTVHNGNMFTLDPPHAHPPPPPGLEAAGTPHLDATKFREAEVARGALQITSSVGVTDLRSIISVRRAFEAEIKPTHKEKDPPEEDWHMLYSQLGGQPDDDQDEGGDEGLNKSDDKESLRVRRSFELLLQNGYTVRFETHSCQNAVEWVERLRALVLYWKHRHRIDAREEMDLAQYSRPRLTPHTHAHCSGTDLPPEPPVDITAPLPALASLYNWCVLEGCKPIVKSGSLFTRKGLYGSYKLVQLFLVSGMIIQFRIKGGYAIHPVRRLKLNLADAYVCSGYFAALTLPNGQYDPNLPPVPRRYQDGLETDDPDEDVMFMIWYRKTSVPVKDSDDPIHNTPASLPKLSAKRKLAVFRARSKLERDTWCWALNCEIERTFRSQRENEIRLRDPGSVVTLPINPGAGS